MLSIFSPCCGFVLQGAVKSLAILGFGVESAMIILHLSSIYIIGIQRQKEEIDPDDFTEKYVRPFNWGLHFVYNVMSLFMSYYLHKFARERSCRAIKKWLIISWFLFLPSIAQFLTQTFWVRRLKYDYMCAAACAAFIPYKFYSLWVVYAFYKEIKYYGGFNSALTELSDQEVSEFFEGHKRERDRSCDDHPYKKESYEVPLERLKVDVSFPLGKGQFSTVYRGILLPEKKPEVVMKEPDLESGGKIKDYIVAVKTVPDFADIPCFKALLSELKILSYLGQHDHVVSLVGACTSQIKQKKLYVIVEFCPMGSILNFLRSHRGLFVDVCNNAPNPDVNLSDYIAQPIMTNRSLTSVDILKWACQTATGMEYISKRKVIHGDLAARNVLLTMDMNVKIADFGLSRQLYQCYNYNKNSNEPLPWRWMAPEALSYLTFSTASDIWSCGITLWEFFTCGEIPFAEHYYTNDFKKLLDNGLRPEKPPHAPPECYQIMWDCWNMEPSSRPSFLKIKESLYSLYNKHVSHFNATK